MTAVLVIALLAVGIYAYVNRTKTPKKGGTSGGGGGNPDRPKPDLK